MTKLDFSKAGICCKVCRKLCFFVFSQCTVGSFTQKKKNGHGKFSSTQQVLNSYFIIQYNLIAWLAKNKLANLQQKTTKIIQNEIRNLSFVVYYELHSVVNFRTMNSRWMDKQIDDEVEIEIVTKKITQTQR